MSQSGGGGDTPYALADDGTIWIMGVAIGDQWAPMSAAPPPAGAAAGAGRRAMSTKEHPGPFDCYAKLADDEPYFVLKATDQTAPAFVALWAVVRELRYGDSPKLAEARECAAEMRRWHAAHVAHDKPPARERRMKTYHGDNGLRITSAHPRNASRVTVNGKPLPPRLDLRNHSPTGFEWGYGGSGPAQLALAILCDHVGDDRALNIYQEFKRRVIACLPSAEWTLTTEEIDRVLLIIRAERAAGAEELPS